jgi:SAM-dependent methyltransferase
VRLDPETWAAVYESDSPTGPAFVFRRSAEVAREACLAGATPDERWLDVGAGTGHLAAELAAAGLDVIGVDDDPSMLRAAEQRFGRNSELGPRFRLAEAERLPFADATVDGVVAASLSGCLAHPRSFFSEVGRVLRPGGRAVVTFTNREGTLHGIGRMFSAVTRAPRSPLFLPVRLYSTRQAVLELEAAGLLVAQIRYYNCFLSIGRWTFPPRRLALPLERLLDNRAGRPIARNFLAVATKRMHAASD